MSSPSPNYIQLLLYTTHKHDLAILYEDEVPKDSKSWDQFGHFLYYVAEEGKDEAYLVFVWFISVINDLLWILGDGEATHCLDYGFACAGVPFRGFGVDEDEAADLSVDHFETLVACSARPNNA